MEDKDVNNKYDRQVRLWSPNGQRCLAEASICLINANILASEILKDLILPGIGSITLVDNKRHITKDDLSSNFFLSSGSIGSLRAPEMAQSLRDLNPDAKVNIESRDIGHLVTLPSFWLQFDCVVVCSFLDDSNEEQLLDDILWRNNICLIHTCVNGFYGFLKITYKEQTIVETHDSRLVDLRIDMPWDKLQDHIDSIKLDQLDDQAFSDVPYSVVLTKVYQALSHENPGKKIMPSAVRKYINEKLRRPGDQDSNLDQACERALLLFKNSRDIPGDLQAIFHELQSKDLDNPQTTNWKFWILVDALNRFYQKYHTLPLSGVLPDMESNTSQYMELTELYHAKFEHDKGILLDMVAKKNREMFTNEELTSFVRNCKFLQVHHGSLGIFNSNVLQKCEDSSSQADLQNINIYIGFLAMRKFYYENHRFPSSSDRSEVRTIAISILCSHRTVKDFPDGLEKVLDEFCRCQGVELHNIAALMGGIGAQEITKVVINQYITLENCLTYDGIKSRAASWKM